MKRYKFWFGTIKQSICLVWPYADFCQRILSEFSKDCRYDQSNQKLSFTPIFCIILLTWRLNLYIINWPENKLNISIHVALPKSIINEYKFKMDFMHFTSKVVTWTSDSMYTLKNTTVTVNDFHFYSTRGIQKKIYRLTLFLSLLKASVCSHY